MRAGALIELGEDRPLAATGRPRSARTVAFLVLIVVLAFADRYWLAVLRPEPVSAEPLGYLTGVDGPSCQVSGALLACRTSADGLAVWRVG